MNTTSTKAYGGTGSKSGNSGGSESSGGAGSGALTASYGTKPTNATPGENTTPNNKPSAIGTGAGAGAGAASEGQARAGAETGDDFQPTELQILPAASRFKVAVYLGQGIEYLHCAAKPAVVHRDVKRYTFRRNSNPPN
jgi:hypothetical protein